MRLLVCVLCAVLAVPLAADRRASAAEPATVSFCYNEWRPYAAEVGGEAVGLSIDILREASRRAGLAPRFVPLPWKRCLLSVETGEIDAVVDAVERPQFIHGDVSFSFYTNTFWVRAGDPVETVDAALGDGRRLGLVSGFVYGDELDRLFRASNVIVDEAIDDGANLLKLAYGRVDTVVTDFASTLAYAKDNALAIRPLEPTYSVDALYTSFNSDRRDVMQRIDKALRSMCDDGWIEQRYVAQLGFGLDAVAGSGGCASGKGGKETG